jgi:cytochrome c oxidase subunit III
LPPSGWEEGGADFAAGPPGVTRRASIFALYLLLVSSAVVFLALVAAFLARRSGAADWVTIPKPRILWANTVLLLASSVFVEVARRYLKLRDRVAFNRWWTAATALGVLFLAGQGLAWQQLRNAGLFIASSPSAAFFYVPTATHAAHVVGAVAALVYVDVQAVRFRLGPAKRTGIDVTAVFWHFLDVMWLCLMGLFYLLG